MTEIAQSNLQLLQQVIIALMAAVIAIFWATWSKSPQYLPLPSVPHRRWLRSVPVFATAVIIGILITWFTDCSYLRLLTTVAIASFFLCAVLMVTHHHLLQRVPESSTVLIVICFGWSILGTLMVSSIATALIAKQNMDEAYRLNPLVLSQVIDREKRKPEDVIHLTANLPAHFQTEMDDCHESRAELSISPVIGRLSGMTYYAPDTIREEQQVTVIAKSPWHHDTRIATIILLPDSPNIDRTQYSGEDRKKRQALFDFIIISKSNSWVFRSDDLVEKNRLGANGDLNPSQKVPVCIPILELAESRQFDPYVYVITIGTASREGKQREEENRADRRGKKIAEWVNAGLRSKSKSKQVYTMNLGQYQTQPGEATNLSPNDTAQERPVVLIGVIPNGEIDLTEALQNVFDRHQDNPFFRFLATHYPGREIVSYQESAKSPCSSDKGGILNKD